tara:strand:+ start:166 stop:969 length:804 start_codon:yes stop_codon:yes gene_type:complete
MLKIIFSPMKWNAKLQKSLEAFRKITKNKNAQGYSMSTPSGFACSGVARDCLTFANKTTGKLHRGLHTQFNCFSAVNESYLPSVRAKRWETYDSLRAVYNYAGSDHVDMASLINEWLPTDADLNRIHVAGEFSADRFGDMYFSAWLEVARNESNKHFYFYTKNIPAIIKNRNNIPSNLSITASLGGMFDAMVFEHKLKYSKVIFHPSDPGASERPTDHDDTLAMFGDIFDASQSFNLLLHATQPKGSDASKAIQRLKRENIRFSYSS